jgi:LysM repeat protein
VNVFDAEAGGFNPGLSDNDASLQVTFTNPTTGGTIAYSYQHSTTPANVAYLVYTLPFAKYTTVQGHPAITSTYGDISEVVMQPDDNTVIVLSSPSVAVHLSDLTAIEFTMATPSDTRWGRLESEVKAPQGTSPGLDGCILPVDKVQPGETPVSFAARAGVTLAELTEANKANPSWTAFAAGSDIVVPIPASPCVPPVLPTPIAQDTIPDCSQPGVTVMVPNVAGMAGDAAIVLLDGTGLRPDQLRELLPNGVVTKPADFVAVSQDLDPATAVGCGSPIRIVLAYKPGPLHVVQLGDTYDSIAGAAGITVKQLLAFNGLDKLQANGILSSHPPRVGEALRLTKPVQRG